MLVTRATRHDVDDVKALLDAEGFSDVNLRSGVAFIARDGLVVGCVRIVEVAPGVLVMDDVVVRSDRRNEGIGTRLIQTAMNSRGGTIYVTSNERARSLYERAGFSEIAFEDLPDAVVEHYRSIGDSPGPDAEGHVYLKAR